MHDVYRRVVDNSAIFSETDAKGVITHANDMFLTISGYARDELIGKDHRVIKSDKHSRLFFSEMWSTISKGEVWRGLICNRTKNGDFYWVDSTIVPIIDESSGKITKYASIRFDVTQQKNLLSKLRWMANHDTLTRLPNRELLQAEGNKIISRCAETSSMCAVCFIDIDNFKEINDTHGHAVGDRVLTSIAHRLSAGLEATDIASRIGGDEFAIVLASANSESEIHSKLRSILARIEAPLYVDSKIFIIKASIGVAIYPSDRGDFDSLLRHADSAMYLCKQRGGGIGVFDVFHDRQVRDDYTLISRIKNAILSGHMQLYYQPKVELKSGTAIGVEALLRWVDPENGVSLPGEFLPTIEKYDTIIMLGEWVIKTAIEQANEWLKSGLSIRIGVNISARQLTQGCFIRAVDDIACEAGSSGLRLIDFEITESVSLENQDYVASCISELDSRGVKFSIDDFGTGYASLAYIKKIPAHTIKIDKSFVLGMLQNEGDLAIIKSIITLSHAFGRLVVAEGVETLQHYEAIKSLGCDYAQGFYIAKPMPASEIVDWIRQHPLARDVDSGIFPASPA